MDTNNLISTDSRQRLPEETKQNEIVNSTWLNIFKIHDEHSEYWEAFLNMPNSFLLTWHEHVPDTNTATHGI